MSVLMRVTAVDYETEGDEVILQVAGRDEHGERRTLKVTGTEPYFFIPDSCSNPQDDAVVYTESGYESYDHVPLTKVVTKLPKHTGKLSDGYDDPYENDIPFYRRASIDYNLSGHIRVPDGDKVRIENIETDVEVEGTEEIDPRIFIADIEVLQGGMGIDEMVEKAENTVTHITIWDSYEDEYHVLYLDEDSKVTGTEVKAELELHAETDVLLNELDQDINLHGYKTEEALLRGFIGQFKERRPDIISGWNFVSFDWRYLLNRLDHFDDLNAHQLSDIGFLNGYSVERRADCVPAFDMLSAYKKMTWSELRSWSLDYVSKQVLGTGKIPDIDINWAFQRDRSRLTAYNIMDVMLCVALDRREDVHGFFYELSELSQIQIYDALYEMRLVDGYIMSHDDTKLPPQTEKDIPANAGGLVLDPSDGIREWVGVHDLKSLYPSVIITWNISPETINWFEDEPTRASQSMTVPWLPDADHAQGGTFTGNDIDHEVMWTDMHSEGLVPRTIKRLFPEREKFKSLRDRFDPSDEMYDVYDRKQAAVKVIMNSFYGVMSNDYWRLGRYGLGDAVTSTARYALWQGKEIARDEGYEVYYGDTDSVMVSLAEADESKADALSRGHALEGVLNDRMVECVEKSGLGGPHPFLDDSLHGPEEHCLVYEFEKLYRRFFQAGKKKRYAGNIVWKEGKDVDGKVDTTGFESQRSDSPELTEEVQPEVIRRILAGQGFSEVSEYIRELIKNIETEEMPLYKIALPKVVNKPLHEYGNLPAARACRFSNDNLDYNWTQGDDPWMVFVEDTPPMAPGTDVIALDWGDGLPEGYDLDLDKTLERAMKGPLYPITNEMNWRFAELRNGAKTESAASDDWASADWNDTEEDDGGEWGW